MVARGDGTGGQGDGLRLSTGLTQSWTYDLSGNITKRQRFTAPLAGELAP